MTPGQGAVFIRTAKSGQGGRSAAPFDGKDEEMSWEKPLICWYQENKRDLPWRRTREAYKVWISEIMLQQTRVEAVIGYYYRFLEAFPTLEDLAAAPVDTVLKYWEGLGYYSPGPVIFTKRPARW